MPTTATPASISQSRNSSSASVVVANVRTSCRRPPRGPATRTHAFRSALPMSNPAHRSNTVSIPAPSHDHDEATVRGSTKGKSLSHVLTATVQGSCDSALSVLLINGLHSTSPPRRQPDGHHHIFIPPRAARQSHDLLINEYSQAA